MKLSINRQTARRIVAFMLFVSIVYAYTALAVKALLRSEQIHPATVAAGWNFAEKLLAFPAFYFGPDPLTGLIINAAIWGLALTKLLLLFWPRREGDMLR